MEASLHFSISGNRNLSRDPRPLFVQLFSGTKDSASRLEGCFAFLITITCLELDNVKVRRLRGSFGVRICQRCQCPSLPTSPLPESSFAQGTRLVRDLHEQVFWKVRPAPGAGATMGQGRLECRWPRSWGRGRMGAPRRRDHRKDAGRPVDRS